MIKNTLREKLAQLLRHELIRNRCKQNHLAEELAITPSAVSQMLQGKIMPSMIQLDKICEVLGLPRQRAFELRCLLSRIRCGSGCMQSPLGELISRLRSEKGMTMRELGEASHLPEHIIELLEMTPDIVPELSDLQKVAGALKIDAGELYEAAGLNWRTNGAPVSPIRNLDGLALREPEAEYTPMEPESANETVVLTLSEVREKLSSLRTGIFGKKTAKALGIAPGQRLEITANGRELDLAGCSSWKLTVASFEELCPGELALIREKKQSDFAIVAVDNARSALVGRKLFRKSNKAIQLSSENLNLIIPVSKIESLHFSKVKKNG